MGFEGSVSSEMLLGDGTDAAVLGADADGRQGGAGGVAGTRDSSAFDPFWTSVSGLCSHP